MSRANAGLVGIMDEMQGQGGAMPEIEVLDRFLDEWKDAVEKAGRIDDTFFGELRKRIRLELVSSPGDPDLLDRVRRVEQVAIDHHHPGYTKLHKLPDEALMQVDIDRAAPQDSWLDPDHDHSARRRSP